jgi:hypothetical protein
MRRGLRAESERDYGEAERCLLEAARVDRQFDPRWTLANYYFRRGDVPQFWTWTRKSLEMSYGDLSAIFRLCWKVTQSAEEIRHVLPPGAHVLAGFARFVREEDRIDAAASASVDLAAYGRAEDAPLLLSVCEKALQQGRVTPALALWKALPEAVVSAPFPGGFGWHRPTDPELSTAAIPSGIRITLSGRQAESCELVWRYVPLTPKQRQKLSFHARTSGAPSASGLRWKLAAWPGGKPLLVESDWLAGEEWKEGELTFSSGDATLARLALTYERARGTARFEGTVAVRDVAIHLAP